MSEALARRPDTQGAAPWQVLEAADVAARLGSDPERGLASGEAARRHATIGLQIYGHHSGILESFLKSGELTWTECLLSTAAAAVPVTGLELWKLARRGMPRGSAA